MAKRILPYRDYSEHDVVNLFSLDTGAYPISSAKQGATGGNWDSGVIVQVSAGTLPGDMHNTDSGLSTSGDLREYLGASPTSAHIGYNAYPYNGMTVTPADGSEAALGITLRETLAYDENGEKMLYYKQKLDEAQAVLPGQTVPVLTRGIVLLGADAFDTTTSGLTVAKGQFLELGGATNGKFDVAATAAAGQVGQVIAVGEDTSDNSKKYLCRISF